MCGAGLTFLDESAVVISLQGSQPDEGDVP
ncbi:MAG: hypothetical protein RL189_2843 [Pseudomonadota bacterium]